jgi:hypothetical protein
VTQQAQQKTWDGILKRIQSNHNKLRTDEVIGVCYESPKVGDSFIMYAESLELKGGTRVVYTTPVLSVVWDPPDGSQRVIGCTFTTQNSTYHLDMVG